MSALCVHGAGGGGWEWNVWRGALEAAGVCAHDFDLLPHPRGLAATGLEDYLAQVRERLLALPRPRALIGASLGGLLASACADRADALVLINALPPAPWHARLPVRDWPEVVPWRCEARLASTRRALPDADDTSALYAFRRWRDESGAVLRAAYAGIAVDAPSCPVLILVSERDEDVPPAIGAAWAQAWDAQLRRCPVDGHVAPLLGREAAAIAAQAGRWLSAR
ncbi:alpha/beta hydrolase [Luteimonas aquatica]|uniref:alpha/beta hydrolase n=1 Tax=Luteimonas aquatica TaxID=450364 RepID=UPI001F58F7BD|nr:alpha/beta hydrolase [Luteimonas aquatica]